MQTNAEMMAELEKLGKAQRKAMRRIVASNLDAVTVEKLGWKTLVYCRANGFAYTVKLGPKGAVLNKSIMEI